MEASSVVGGAISLLGNRERTGKGSMREQVRDGLSNRLSRDVKQERYGEGDVSPEGCKSDVEVGSVQEVMDKEQSGQKGTKRNSRAGKERKEAQTEDGRSVYTCGVGTSAQPTSDSAQPKSAKRSRETERGISDRKGGNSEEEYLEEVSGEAENSTLEVKGGQKDTERAARARKEAESEANIGSRNRIIRREKFTGGCAQLESRKNRRASRHVKEEEMSEAGSEEEGPDENSSEAGNPDSAISGDLGRGKHVERPTKNRLSKRKSDEIDLGVEKNVRRRGSRCESHTLAYFSLNLSRRHLY